MGFWNQVKGWEICTFILCAILVLFYIGQRIDFENAFKKDSPTPVHMGGAIQATSQLSDVAVVDIPKSVYDSLEKDPKYKRYLTGNHKYILLFTYNKEPLRSHSSKSLGGMIAGPIMRSIAPNDPYCFAFKDTFKQAGFAEYYRKRIITIGGILLSQCPCGFENCATAWINKNCFMNLCILNPQRKQVVIDSSQNAEQLPKLLEKYKEW